MISFTQQKLFNLMWSYVFIFAFAAFAFGVKSKKNHRQDQNQGSYPICFHLGFTVSGLTFKFSIPFELIFAYLIFEIVV